MGFSRQEYRRVATPFSRGLPDPGMETHLTSPALTGRFFTTSVTWEAQGKQMAGVVLLPQLRFEPKLQWRALTVTQFRHATLL